jgi:hypothetical protein
MNVKTNNTERSEADEGAPEEACNRCEERNYNPAHPVEFLFRTKAEGFSLCNTQWQCNGP